MQRVEVRSGVTRGGKGRKSTRAKASKAMWWLCSRRVRPQVWDRVQAQHKAYEQQNSPQPSQP
jgi:hypothetical protein